MCPTLKSSGTVVYVASEGVFAGAIVISDTVKDGAEEAIKRMKQAGVKKCVMLTGDRKEAAESVAAQLGIDEVYAELLPGDKVVKVEKLLENQRDKEKLAFAGDGINDAPVLTRADIGIAMGSMGSDAAIEAADVVLMDDDVRKIASTVHISRKTLRIVKQNIVFALGVPKKSPLVKTSRDSILIIKLLFCPVLILKYDAAVRVKALVLALGAAGMVQQECGLRRCQISVIAILNS